MLHLSLDLFGTLIKSNPKYKEARVKVFKDNIKFRYGIEMSYDDCYDTIRLAEKMFDKAQETSLDQQTIYSSIDSILNMLLIADGKVNKNLIKVSHIETIYNELDEIWFKYPPELYEGCEEMLNNLAEAGVTFNILSNTSLVRGVIIDKWLQNFKFYKNILFSLYSDMMGICKPNDKVYEYVIERSPENSKIYHVGDNVFTDGACINSGILFVYVNNSNIDRTTVKLLTNLYAQHYVLR